MSSRGTQVVDGVAADAVAALTVALDAVLGLELWRLPDGDLAGLVAVAHRAESRCAALGVAALGEAVERGLPGGRGVKHGAVWLRGLVPVTHGAASARAGLAEAFGTAAHPAEDLAATRQAFAAGDLSVGHASVVVRTIGLLEAAPDVDEATRDEAQELLLRHATRLDPAQFGRVGRALGNRLDPQAAERLARDEDAQQDAREAYLVQERSGMWLLRALLPPVAGAALCTALDPLARPEPAADLSPDPRPARQRLADALHGLAELSLAARAGQPGGLPTRAGASTRLVLTAELSTVLADLSRSPVAAAGASMGVLDTGQPGGWEVSPLTTQVLSCGAEVVPILLDDATGRPLDVGATRYAFPPRIRRAIELRDRHCTFDDCTAKPAWCHTHHLIPFGRNGKPGGPTSEANGGLLCGPHHRKVHAEGWIGTIINGQVRWRRTNHDDDTNHSHNAWTQELDHALKHLAQRWLNRNPHLKPPPPDTS